MLDTASLTDILQYLEEKDGHITVNRVMETASLYDGKAPPAAPVRGSHPLKWRVFNELLERHWIEKMQGSDVCKISAEGIKYLALSRKSPSVETA